MTKVQSAVVGVVIVIILIGGAVMFSNKKSNSPTATNEPVKIGYVGPLTGDVAVLGTDASKAIELAVEKANANGGIKGRKIELFVEDDQYDTAKSISAYEKLVNVDGVDTIIMSTYGGVMALSEKAKKDNVLIIDSLDCDQDIANLGDNVFCVAKETKDLADVIANFAVSEKYKNVGILHSTTDNFMQSVAVMFKDKVGDNANVKIESYAPKTNDFKTSLLKLKDSDALVLLGYDEIGIAMKQARDLGLKQPFLTIPTVATTPSIQAASKGTIDGTYFSFYAPLENNAVATKFYEDFKSKNGRTPYVFVASDQAYDAANILIEQVLPKVEAGNKEGSIAQKIAALQSVTNFKGVSGTLSMKQDGRIGGILIRLFKLVDMKPTFIGINK